MITKTLFIILGVFSLSVFAPLVSGIIRKIKDNLRMRQGMRIFQPYYNLSKLFSKDEVISKHTSWIFHIAPVVVFVSTICACFLFFIARQNSGLSALACLLALFFVLSLGRFFLALAGLDAASSFGGMGSSREMFISSFAEPIAFVSVLVLFMNSTPGIKTSVLLAGFAFFMVVISETSRIPVDNQETHLELTMVHEAMVLEYSGRNLALIELTSHIKQILLFVIISLYFFPFEIAALGWMLFPVKIILIGVIIALVELSVAKMRLFRVVDFLGFSFFIALLAVIAASLGY